MGSLISRQARWIAFACVALLLLMPLAASARQTTEQATIYMVAMGDNGQSGIPVGSAARAL